MFYRLTTEVLDSVLEDKVMEQSPEDLKRELELIEQDLRNTKQQQLRITKAAELLGNSIKRLCVREKERLGFD